MSNHNYGGHYNRDTRETKRVADVVEPAKEVKPVETVEEPAVVAPPKTLQGVVYNCDKLNVRTGPDAKAKVVCIIDKGAEVQIDNEYSIEGWYKVCVENGAEGFCMKNYINVQS